MKKVFVSGCYDMLHSGHVAFFEEAAGYGDLYVGIGSDKTVNELKIEIEAVPLTLVVKDGKVIEVVKGADTLKFRKYL